MELGSDTWRRIFVLSLYIWTVLLSCSEFPPETNDRSSIFKKLSKWISRSTESRLFVYQFCYAFIFSNYFLFYNELNRVRVKVPSWRKSEKPNIPGSTCEITWFVNNHVCTVVEHRHTSWQMAVCMCVIDELGRYAMVHRWHCNSQIIINQLIDVYRCGEAQSTTQHRR